MYSTPLHYTAKFAGPDERSSLPIPTVYESIPDRQAKWEYHLLSINPAEAALPAAEQLNALGRDGWILVSVLDERVAAHGKLVHYYFVRHDLTV
jgi:hypothetical protein